MNAKTMKALVHYEYGSPDLLTIKDVPRPTPAPGQVLVQIRAVSINGSDRENLAGKPFYARFGGLTRPGNPILGSDIAGVVVQVGENHTEFKPGDEIFGELPGYHGGIAEYACTHGRTMIRKPPGLTFEEAAAIPQAGVIALRGICDTGRVQPGQHVLINGAGGSAGAFAIQIAKNQGAEVTGVDNPHKQGFMRALGADHVIDFTQQDYAGTGHRFDLILDLIALKTIFRIPKALRPNGKYFVVGGRTTVLLQALLIGPLLGRNDGKRIRVLAVPQNREDLAEITELVEAGKVNPIIDRQFSLDEAQEAMRYVVEGRSQGKIIISP